MTRWSWYGAALVLLVGCGHHTPEPGKGSGSGPPVLIKSVAISFASQPGGETSSVFLPVMDETGKVTSYPVGDFPGTCATIPADGKDLATLSCTSGGSTVRLHAIQQGQDVVVLSEPIAAGAKPDPMNRQEVARFSMPADAAIKPGT
jgi:hypothetical protein